MSAQASSVSVKGLSNGEISESVESELWQHTRAAVAQQPFIDLLGITLAGVGEGWVEMLLPIEERVLQHDGLVHGGALATLADIACALAAHTQMPADQRVVTVELKINYLRAVMPEGSTEGSKNGSTAGRSVRCRGEVLRRGRMLTVSEGRLYAHRKGKEVLVAVALATITGLSDPPKPE